MFPFVLSCFVYAFFWLVVVVGSNGAGNRTRRRLATYLPSWGGRAPRELGLERYIEDARTNAVREETLLLLGRAGVGRGTAISSHVAERA